MSSCVHKTASRKYTSVGMGAGVLVHYPSLTWTQRQVYDEMLPHLRAAQCEFDIFTDCEPEDVFAASHAIKYERPELFWFAGVTRVQRRVKRSRALTKVTASTLYPLESVPSMRRRIGEEVRRCTSRLPSNATRYDRVRVAYEFVIGGATYDLSSLQNQSMAAVFLDHRAVCAGYSLAFCYLLRLMGVPCGCVQGEADNGAITGPHLWNIVCIDGVLAYVDTTWGEMEIVQGNGKRSEGISYKYLCVTTEEILRSRTITPGQKVPLCTSRKFDWFARQGLLLSSFSAKRFDAILADALARKESGVSVKFDTQAAFDQCVRWMGTSSIYAGAFGRRLMRSQWGKKRTLSWMHDDCLRVVSVLW